MAFQGVSDPAEVDKLIKDLATQGGAKVRNNISGTTNLIAFNGNTYNQDGNNTDPSN